MRYIFTVLLLGFLGFSAAGQSSDAEVTAPNPAKGIQTVEVSCGKCKLGLAGKSCDMAVRINDKAYYVDGADIDNFGDAHAPDGLCNAIRKAEVQGELVENRFNVTYIKLLPEVKKEEKKQ